MEGGVEEQRKKVVVCVTGASGFVASWLVKRLLERGYHVRGTVRNLDDKAKTAHLQALEGAQERLELWPANLLSEGSFDAVVDGCHGVFHTATPVKIVKSDPQVEMIDPAVKGTLNVLRSCAKSSSVKRVVLTSSSATVRFREDIKPYESLDELNWTSLELCEKYQLWYAKAKVLAEKAAWEFAEQNSLDLVVVLPSFVIGPVLPPDLSSTASDVLGLLKGESKSFAYHGRMGYVHIDDVATAHILLFEQPSARGRYLCSSIVLESSELAKRLAVRYPELNIPQEFETFGGERPLYLLNSLKLEKLGICFKTVEDMFDDCISSFKERGLLP
ncbi:hypothetical protein GOP47_0006030 [Adiantum capillus-veneris]|uniref:NAD-dependent epimerase/dehydratase domain-containing protein n=1 Tax=Adiantum capillus-veneris TaxID=13818 RepID=A0A9D4V262_ADICA|nr:hypothetical protein GOP47_0006030 [Adiantum capillus-veneris]